MTITTEEFIASAIQEGVIQASIMKIDDLNDSLNYAKNNQYYEDFIEESEFTEEERMILAQEASDNLEFALQNIIE